MGDPVLDALHDSLVGVLVHFPDPLVGEDEPVVPGPGEGSRTLRGHHGPLLLRQEGEDPAVRRHLALLPDAVGILPDMRSPDGHAGVDLSPELLQIVVRYGTLLHLLPPTPFRGGRVKVEGLRERV